MTNKLNFCFVISQGFSFRMLTQTDLLAKLSKENKIGIIVKDSNDNIVRKYCEKNKITLIQLNINSRLIGNYLQLRKYLLEDIRSNIALKEKHFYKISNSSFYLKLFYRILYFINIILPNNILFKRFVNAFERYFFTNIDLNKKLSNYKIDNIVSTYPVDPLEACVLNYAKINNINSITQLLSWDNILCKGYFPSVSKYYFVWGNVMKQELIDYYNIPKKKIKKVGVPHFDIHLDKDLDINFLQNFGIRNSSKCIFYGMSSPRFNNNEIDIVEYLAYSLKSGKYGKDTQLIIRPHPQIIQKNTGLENRKWLKRLKKIKNDDVLINFPILSNSGVLWNSENSEMINLTNLLKRSSVSINTGSTLIIDSFMCRTPVILSAFDIVKNNFFWSSAKRLLSYPHLKKIIKYDSIFCANSLESLDNYILMFLKNKNNNKSSIENTLNDYCENFKKPSTNYAVKEFQKFNN